MNRNLERLVWRRARFCCEYCQMPQELDGFGHEIDHVIARKHGGPTIANNLALACFPCNNHKGANIAGIDPATKQLTRLFNPRRHKWQRHFRWDGPYLIGKTAIGRVTISVLEINIGDRVLLRRSLIEEGPFRKSNHGAPAMPKTRAFFSIGATVAILYGPGGTSSSTHACKSTAIQSSFGDKNAAPT